MMLGKWTPGIGTSAGWRDNITQQWHLNVRGLTLLDATTSEKYAARFSRLLSATNI